MAGRHAHSDADAVWRKAMEERGTHEWCPLVQRVRCLPSCVEVWHGGRHKTWTVDLVLGGAE